MYWTDIWRDNQLHHNTMLRNIELQLNNINPLLVFLLPKGWDVMELDVTKYCYLHKKKRS